MSKNVLQAADYNQYQAFQEELISFTKLNNIYFKSPESFKEHVEKNPTYNRFTILELYSVDKEKAIWLTSEDTFLIADKREHDKSYTPTLEIWFSTEKIDEDDFEFGHVEDWIEIKLSELIPYLEEHLSINLTK